MPDRLVRDELLTSERYWSVSPEARNLYVSILLSADDTGRYTASSFALRTKCMAGTVSAERIEKLLLELVDVDLIRLYSDGPGRYLFIPRYRQRLRYPNSRYPEPPIGISDITEKKTDSGPSQDSPKTAEVKRSEVKRSEKKEVGVDLSLLHGEVPTLIKKPRSAEPDPAQIEKNRAISEACRDGNTELAKRIRDGH